MRRRFIGSSGSVAKGEFSQVNCLSVTHITNPWQIGACPALVADERKIKKHSTIWLTVGMDWNTFNHMVNSGARLDAVFHALSDPTRRSILQSVAVREQTVGEIAKPYQVSLAAVSKHLKVLETANLIRRERRGSFQVVHLNPATLRPAEEWLAYYEQFWNRQLDSLQKQLEGEEHE